MARLSTIKRLPPEIRAHLDAWLRDDAVTAVEAAARVNELLAELHPNHPQVSRQAVNRYNLARRGPESWRKAYAKIAPRTGPVTTDAAAEAGDEMGALVAPLIPFELRMRFVAALVSRLASDPFATAAAESRSASLSAEVELTPEEARAGSGLSFTLGELARACGVSRGCIQHLAAKAGWRYTKEPYPGAWGYRKLYRFEELPGNVAKKALARHARSVAK